MGLGFLMQTTYLLPLTIAALAVALAALGYRASRRRGYGPFVLGVAAAAGMISGKFIVASDAAVYAGVGALIGASLWNSWPKQGVPPAPAETLLQLGSMKKENEDGC
jgi:mercuric ion transport protein